MAHPTRGFASRRRMWRCHPNRTNGSLWGYAGKSKLLDFSRYELFWSNVSGRDAQIIAQVREETRTWKIPAEALGDTEMKTGFRIHPSDGTRWEILSINLRSARTVWHCVCVKLEVDPA